MSITRLRPPPLDFLATDYSPPKPTKKVRPNPQQVWPHFGGTLFSAANGAHRRSRQLVFTSPADIAQPPHCTEDTSHLPRVPQPHTAPSLPSAHNKDISACPRPVSSGFLSVFLAPIPASSTPPFPPGGGVHWRRERDSNPCTGLSACFLSTEVPSPLGYLSR